MFLSPSTFSFFFFNDTATTEIYTLSLHDALPIYHLIVDQAVHPRPHVGESLLCSTSRIFQEIGFLSVMEQENFVHKHGAVWTHWADPRQYVVRFREIPELGLSQDYTYHVDRGRFDELLLQHASSRGSRVRQGARVERVVFGADGFASG